MTKTGTVGKRKERCGGLYPPRQLASDIIRPVRLDDRAEPTVAGRREKQSPKALTQDVPSAL